MIFFAMIYRDNEFQYCPALPWRSEEFETVLRSLDRKRDRRRDSRSKAMCLEVQMGENSLREKPEGLPDWANNLHHQLFA